MGTWIESGVLHRGSQWKGTIAAVESGKQLWSIESPLRRDSQVDALRDAGIMADEVSIIRHATGQLDYCRIMHRLRDVFKGGE